MSWTTVDQFTREVPNNGEIKNGDGYFKTGHTFFYWEDIMKVLEPAIGDDVPLSNLQLVNVKFERSDGVENHNRHEISVLALKRTDAQIAAMNGGFDDNDKNKSKWYPNAALPWPPIYKRRSTESLIDDDNPGFIGLQFEGSDSYPVGGLLLK